MNALVLKRDMIKGGEKITYALNSVGLLLLNYKEKITLSFSQVFLSSLLHFHFFIEIINVSINEIQTYCIPRYYLASVASLHCCS